MVQYMKFRFPKSPSKFLVHTRFEPHAEWEMTYHNSTISEKKYACCADPYQAIEVTMRIKRKSSFYYNTMLYPAVSLATSIVFAALIPWTIGERISFGVTVTLAFFVLLLMVSDHLPKTEKSSYFLNVFLVLTYFSVVYMIGLLFWTAWEARKADQAVHQKLQHDSMSKVAHDGNNSSDDDESIHVGMSNVKKKIINGTPAKIVKRNTKYFLDKLLDRRETKKIQNESETVSRLPSPIGAVDALNPRAMRKDSISTGSSNILSKNSLVHDDAN